MIVWILLWLFYFILHSVLAADAVKSSFLEKMGARFRYYRIGYNLLAIGTLTPLLVWYRTLTPFVLWQPPPLMEILAAGLFLAGLVVGYLLHSGTDTHLAVFVVVLAYLIIGSRLEERKPEATYGDAYRAYQQRVRQLIPFIF